MHFDIIKYIDDAMITRFVKLQLLLCTTQCRRPAAAACWTLFSQEASLSVTYFQYQYSEYNMPETSFMMQYKLC